MTGRRRGHGEGTIYQRDDGLWVGRTEAGWTSRGTRRRVQVTAKTRAECARKLKEKRRELLTSGPAAEGIRAGTTVKAWAAEWLDMQERRVRPATFRTDASLVRSWVIPTIGARRLADLTPGDVRHVADAVRRAGRSSTTGAAAVGATKRMLKAATAEGHPVPPRALMAEPPAKAVTDRDAIPTPDALALMRAARELPHGSRWAAALLAGLRPSEALGLTWDAVDLDAGTLTIEWQLAELKYRDRAAGTFVVPDGYDARHLVGAYHLVRPKTRAGWRVVPLVPWLRGELAAWRDVWPPNPWGLVWVATDDRPGRGGTPIPRSTKRDRKEFVRLQVAAHVRHQAGRPYVPHETRHTTATLLLEAGVDQAVVTAILGHSSITTSRGYQHVSRALAAQAMAAVADRLGVAALEGPAPQA